MADAKKTDLAMLRSIDTSYALDSDEATAIADAVEEIERLRALLKEAKVVAALKYEVTHKGSGPPSNYDPDIYQLEPVTSKWWDFVHAVRNAEPK